MASDNKTLGHFQLTGIPAAPRGVPQVEVKFDIDANGIVHVTAKDLGTNKEQSITITSNTSLSDEEIEHMMKEAEANKDADKKKKEEADLRNEAEQILFQTEKSIKDLGDKVEKKEKEEAETAMKDLKEALEKDDLEEIKTKKDALTEKAMALATKVYEQVQKDQENQKDDSEESSGGETKTEDGVQEANYEEK